MKVWKMTVEVCVAADTADEAMEHLVGEFDYMFELDNQLLAYTHPQTANLEQGE